MTIGISRSEQPIFILALPILI